MHFLTPWFWIGAATLAVPVFIHLVERPRRRRLPFPSLMFLRQIPLREVRRRRLAHLALLALRMSALFLLVAAFANPVVPAAWFAGAVGHESRSLIICIDHSYSMSRPRVWQRALQAARRKIDSLRQGDEALLMQFGENVQLLSGWERSRRPLELALSNRVSQSFERTSYAEGLRAAAGQLQDSKNPRREIFLITDLQRSGMEGSSDWRVPAGVLLEIRDVGESTPNFFINQVRLERHLFMDHTPRPIVVGLGSVEGAGTSGAVKLFLGEKLVQRRSYTMGPGGRARVTFSPLQVPEGISRGRLVLQPGDSLERDNTYAFILERRPPRRILVLGQERRSSFYLERALSSGENLPFTMEWRPTLAQEDLDPAGTPLLILDDRRVPPPAEVLQKYLEAGGSVLAALGNTVRPASYNDSGLFPARLGARHFVRRSGVPFTSLEQVAWQHPVFSVFGPGHRSSILSAEFYSFWELSAAPGARVLSRFAGGSPALVEGSRRRGKIVMFASTLDPVWNNLPLKSAFVPFWDQMAQYLAGWKSSRAALKINELLAVERTPMEASAGSWELIDPAGQRVIGLRQESPAFLPLAKPGYYEIRARRRSDWVAVNCDPAESDLTRVGAEELQAVLGARRTHSDRAGGAERREKPAERPLWRALLMATFFLLALESWVSRRTRPALAAATPGGGEGP